MELSDYDLVLGKCCINLYRDISGTNDFEGRGKKARVGVTVHPNCE